MPGINPASIKDYSGAALSLQTNDIGTAFSYRLYFSTLEKA
jgi:hypothetical protein